MNKGTVTINGEVLLYGAEEVYQEYYDTAGNYHYCGVVTGQHTIKNVCGLTGKDEQGE